MIKQYVKLAMLSLALFLVGCGEKAEYVNVIPAESSIVATFDCEQMAKESGLLSANPNEAQSKLKESLLDQLSVGQADLASKILADPSSSGINWKQKAYLFMEPESNAKVIALSVLDKEKLKFTVEVMGKQEFRGKFYEEDGCTWINSRTHCVVFNDKACLLAEAGLGETMDDLKKNLSAWMSQSADKSFVSTKYYDRLSDVEGDIKVYAHLHKMSDDMSVITNMVYPEMMDVKTIKYFSGISFEKGKMIAEGNLLIEDEHLLEWLKEQTSSCQKLRGKSLKKYPKDTPLWVGLGLDGDKLYDHLLEHPVYGKELENMRLPFDMERVLRSVDGDISLGYPNGIFIDVTNRELLKVLVGTSKTIGGWIGVELNEINEDAYKVDLSRRNILNLRGNDSQAQIGMDGKTFYFVSNAAVLEDLTEENSLAEAPWADEVKGNLIFGAFSFSSGERILNEYNRSRKTVKNYKNHFDYITYSQDQIENNRIVLSFKDKERNAIEQLLEMSLTK